MSRTKYYIEDYLHLCEYDLEVCLDRFECDDHIKMKSFMHDILNNMDLKNTEYQYIAVMKDFFMKGYIAAHVDWVKNKKDK